MNKLLLLIAMSLAANEMHAQKIDFSLSGRSVTQVCEVGFSNWAFGRVPNATMRFAKNNNPSDSITVTASSNDGYAVTCVWNKNIVQINSKLLGDGVIAGKTDALNNWVYINGESTTLKFTISGLDAGTHTLLAYHSNPEGGYNGKSLAPIDIYVDGQLKESGIKQTTSSTTIKETSTSYITFEATAGKDVVVEYISTPQAGMTYDGTFPVVDALEFDVENIITQAASPVPASGDNHATHDNGALKLSWSPAAVAVKHQLYLGTGSDNLALQSEQTDTTYSLSSLSSLKTYYWRVDEVDANGKVYTGKVWNFQTSRLAFPEAEGYGRFAIGGRGGDVYHVTNLNDDGIGSFRYGITTAQGPRTIVFDVSGVIELKSRLTCSQPYVTIAGQTAPGTGIMLKGCPFGMATDGITRFLRMRLGHKNLVNGIVESSGGGLDGMGMAGNNNAIMDHCSISWTIDEGFSSRNAKNITLQRTLISEALNQAGHPNYPEGTQHGYAATIGGGEMGGLGSTFHHNLLSHNEGRNWSMSGGLDGAGAYDGHHDMFNNVVYNWGGRACDGGTHEGQFVNNYYKEGVATHQPILLKADLEGTGTGSQSYYVNGNIREELDGTRTQDALDNTYKYTVSNGQTINWTVFVDKPFFPSYATIESAETAFKTVLSDVGANQPFLDNHDERMINETLNGTYSTVGSRSGIKGLIDSEEDPGCEGFTGLNITTDNRPEGWDLDGDGIPAWYERLRGWSDSTPNNNTDSDGNDFTDLEEYLIWAAQPNRMIQPGASTSIALSTLFRGFNDSPAFAYQYDGSGLDVALSEEGYLTISAHDTYSGLQEISVTVNDGAGATMTRKLNVAVSDVVTGIKEISKPQTQIMNNDEPSYSPSGQKIGKDYKGIVVKRGKKLIKR